MLLCVQSSTELRIGFIGTDWRIDHTYLWFDTGAWHETKIFAWYCSPALLSFFVKILIPKNSGKSCLQLCSSSKTKSHYSSHDRCFWIKKKTYSGRKFKMDLLWQYRTIKTTMYFNVCQRVFSIGFNKLTKYLYWNSKISLNFTFQSQPIREQRFFQVINSKPGNKLLGLPY